MSIPCEAGCGRYFQRQSYMHRHLFHAESCRAHVLERLAAWDDEDGDTEIHPPQEADYGEEFDEDGYYAGDNADLYSIVSNLNLGPRDTVFIPHEPDTNRTAESEFHGEPGQAEGAGPGPQTAANRLRRAALILDDEIDERITITHPNAGVVRRKESPPSFRFEENDEDGDVEMEGPDQLPLSPFRPFNSELDWKIAQWAIKDGPGQNAFDRFLSVPGVSVP